MKSGLSWTVIALILGLLVAGCGGTPEVEMVDTAPLVVADFDSCTGINNLGGHMGAAYNAPDKLVESYVEEAEHGCVARLNYEIRGWSAFWIKLQDADLTPYSRLVFDVKADRQPGIPERMKIELKRANGAEVSITYVSGIMDAWTSISIPFADLGPTGYTVSLSSFSGMGELVFTFEASESGSRGLVYLDNITFDQ
jgi:hypothetical protein